MSAVRVRHRPPAFALRASARRAALLSNPSGLKSELRFISSSKRSVTSGECSRVGVVLRRSVCVDENNGDGRVHRVMKYVYIINSLENSDRYYVGITGDLKARLAKHNAGDVTHTSKFAPWNSKPISRSIMTSVHSHLKNILNPHPVVRSRRSGCEY